MEKERVTRGEKKKRRLKHLYTRLEKIEERKGIHPSEWETHVEYGSKQAKESAEGKREE